MIETVFEELKESPEPWAVAIGGPRSQDLSFTYAFSISEVDGGAVDVLDEIKQLIIPELQEYVGDKDLHIASAFVMYDKDILQDSYIFTVTLSVHIA